MWCIVGKTGGLILFIMYIFQMIRMIYYAETAGARFSRDIKQGVEKIRPGPH